jgi:hypothetical protein
MKNCLTYVSLYNILVELKKDVLMTVRVGIWPM